MRSFLENIGRFAKSPSRDQSRYGGDDARSQPGRLSTLHSLETGVGVGGSARARRYSWTWAAKRVIEQMPAERSEILRPLSWC